VATQVVVVVGGGSGSDVSAEVQREDTENVASMTTISPFDLCSLLNLKTTGLNRGWDTQREKLACGRVVYSHAHPLHLFVSSLRLRAGMGTRW
jgi:hypothetical protein